MIYLINILIGICLYAMGAVLICHGHFQKKPALTDFCFLSVVSFFYLWTVLSSIRPNNGANLWSVTPISNVSPFLLSLCLLTLMAPKSLKNKLYPILCLFLCPMCFAGFFTSGYAFVTQAPFFWFVFTDEYSHLAFSLFCLYLLKSGQVCITRKNLAEGFAVLFSAVFLVIGVNLVFDTAFFGLSFTGKHNVYGFVFFRQGWLSNLAFLMGLATVMGAGYWFAGLLQKSKSVTSFSSGASLFPASETIKK